MISRLVHGKELLLKNKYYDSLIGLNTRFPANFSNLCCYDRRFWYVCNGGTYEKNNRSF